MQARLVLELLFVCPAKARQRARHSALVGTVLFTVGSSTVIMSLASCLPMPFCLLSENHLHGPQHSANCFLELIQQPVSLPFSTNHSVS